MRLVEEIERMPIPVGETRVWRFYRGGQLIDELRGRRRPEDGEFPEDWIGSVTTANNPGRDEPEAGLSRARLPNGDERLLCELVEAQPEAFLGREHTRAYGASTGLLVKLLDPAERLPVHAHPDRKFARRVFDSRFGKTEAWIILGVREGANEPEVHLGLKKEVDPSTYLRWIREQDTESLLGSLHQVPVREGDVLYVPAGMPHAIGADVLIAELQEPSDFSIVCEYEGFPIAPEDGHLGLGWEGALDALDLSPLTQDELEARCRVSLRGNRILHGECERFFSAELLRGGESFVGGRFAVALCLTGDGAVVGDFGELPVSHGDTFVLPAAAGGGELRGDAEILLCYGPSLR